MLTASNAPTSTLTPDSINYLNAVMNEVNAAKRQATTAADEAKAYVNSLTIPEENMIAESDIENNKYFMFGNILYKATAPILTGEQIIIDTNCIKVNLADALNTFQTKE